MLGEYGLNQNTNNSTCPLCDKPFSEHSDQLASEHGKMYGLHQIMKQLEQGFEWSMSFHYCKKCFAFRQFLTPVIGGILKCDVCGNEL